MKNAESVEGASGQKAVDWRSLFSASTDQTLRFYPPQRLKDKVIVAPPKEVIEERGGSMEEHSGGPIHRKTS